MNLAENMLRIQESGHAGLSVANFLDSRVQLQNCLVIKKDSNKIQWAGYISIFVVCAFVIFFSFFPSSSSSISLDGFFNYPKLCWTIHPSFSWTGHKPHSSISSKPKTTIISLLLSRSLPPLSQITWYAELSSQFILDPCRVSFFHCGESGGGGERIKKEKYKVQR